MINFERYATLRGYGGAVNIPSNPAARSYLFDLKLMLVLAEGLDEVVAINPDNETLIVRAGITSQSEINGLAERVSSSTSVA